MMLMMMIGGETRSEGEGEKQPPARNRLHLFFGYSFIQKKCEIK